MAPKKRSGSGASKVKKKKKPSAPAHESDDDGGDDMEEETDGPVPKKVAFGARFMLFRVLMLTGAPVSFARGAGNVAKLLSAAAQKGATWARCGSDGRAGLLHHRHFSDSRVHRCGREVGFIRGYSQRARCPGERVTFLYGDRRAAGLFEVEGHVLPNDLLRT